MTREQVADLPSDTRAALLAKAEIPGHVRTHRLSPAEVAARGASELTQLPDSVIPLLVPRTWARVVTVKSDRTIQLSDQLLGSEPMHYVCRIKDDQGGGQARWRA